MFACARARVCVCLYIYIYTHTHKSRGQGLGCVRCHLDLLTFSGSKRNYTNFISIGTYIIGTSITVHFDILIQL